MAPRTTSAAGGITPVAAVKPSAPLSKLPNKAVVKMGKVSGKKNKAANDSSRAEEETCRAFGGCSGDRSAGELACGVDGRCAQGVGSNNSHWFQTNEVHFDDHEFDLDEDGEGIVDAPEGRAHNYTMDEDVLQCNTWLQVSRGATVRWDQSRDAYWIRMKEHFDLRKKSGIDRSKRSLRSRWSTINKDCQRWATALKAVDKLNPSGNNDRDRPCEGVNEESNKHKQTIDLADDEKHASSDDDKRSLTPNSVAYSKPRRPN
ncbi:putative receptor protein kinase ZmPK1 [Hordeum vulgare]|nr:putative receptor protein kinase ZmPK1 [Hordeum vulgare]